MDKEKRNARQARYRQQASRSRLEIMITPELLERFRSLQGLEEATNVQKLEALCNAWEATRAVKEVLPELEDAAAETIRIDSMLKKSKDTLKKADDTLKEYNRHIKNAQDRQSSREQDTNKPEDQEELPILAAIAQQDKQPSADNLAFAEEITTRLLVMNPLKNFKINWDEERQREGTARSLKKLEELYGPIFTDAITSGRVRFRPIDLEHYINLYDEPKRRAAILKLLEKKKQNKRQSSH